MKFSFRHLSSFIFFFSCACPLLAAEPFRFPIGRQGRAELAYLQELPVLQLSGTPEEIGMAVGRLALAPGKRAVEFPLDLLKRHKADALWPLFTRTGEGMVKTFPAAYRIELEAMVTAGKVQRDNVVVGNTFFDLKKVFACSALLLDSARSATGGPILGRNLDYPSLGYLNDYSLVTVYRPQGKRAFVSVGFPGLIGCLSGMNDAGLALGVLEVYDVKDGEKAFNPLGLPYALCQRKILEECSTIAEAKQLLESLPRTTTLNLALADRLGVAIFEVTPARVVMRNAQDGLAACTNHYCTHSLRPAEPLDINRSFQRYRALDQLRSNQAKLTLEDVRRQLDAVNLGGLTLQTMAFEPAGLKLHLAIGASPASRHPFKTLDLGPLFKGQP